MVNLFASDKKNVVSESDRKKIMNEYRIDDAVYTIQVNTPYQSMGKFYHQVLDILRKRGGFKLEKVSEHISVSPTSALYGDIAQRRQYAIQQFNNAMKSISSIMQTVIKIIYDLREFDIILDNFDKLKEGDSKEKFAAEQNLRRIYLDEVDIKKGRGSINQLASAGGQQGGLQMVALRDSFMVVRKLKDIDDLKINDRVKRILKGRFNEYKKWKEEYEKDIRGRKKIEMQFLNSQVESLKMQLDIARPYYTVMNQLDVGTGVNSPDLIAGLDTSIIKAKIRGVHKKGAATGFLDVNINMKTKPQQVRTKQGQTFHHIFRIDITYTPYAMPNSVYEKIKHSEVKKDVMFLETVVGKSLEAIKDDLEKYLKGGVIYEEDEDEDYVPFEFLFYPFKPLISGFKMIMNPKPSQTGYSQFQIKRDLKKVRSEMAEKSNDVYELFKDENSYMTWSSTLVQ